MALFLADITPNFVKLDMPAIQIADFLVHDLLAGLTNAHHQPHDGLPMNPGHALDRPNGNSFNQRADDCRLTLDVQFIH